MVMRITVEKFRQNEALCSSFAELLEKPEMRVALEAIRDLGFPREIAPPAGVGFTEWNSHQNARREGYFQALEALLALGVPVRPRKTDADLMPNLEVENL
jgi:hypothetical protein